jgi:WD40 repeat protein
LYSIAFSPDAAILASAGSGDNTISLWDVAMYQPIVQLKGHTAAVNSLAFSPDGKMLAAASDDGTIILWE